MFLFKNIVRLSLEEYQIRLSIDELTLNMRILIMTDMALILIDRAA